MRSRILAIFVILLFPVMAARAQKPVNAAGFDQGAVLLSYTQEFGERSAAEWIALELIDGSPLLGWSSKKTVSFPYEFLFELHGTYSLSELVFDTTHVDQAGRSARGVRVLASTAGEDGPFSTIFEGEIADLDETRVPLPGPVEARFLKLQILGNWGSADYVELMEFQAIGTALDAGVALTPYQGTYQTNWDKFFITSSGEEISGCYDHDEGTFSGARDGRFMSIEWRETGPQIGKAVMAVTPDRRYFAGFWYEQGTLRGTWMGSLLPSGVTPKCASALVNASSSRVEQSLDRDGRAVLYGLYFDVDSANIRPDSALVLSQLQNWLLANPSARLAIEGHTDSDGTDAYNQGLSQARALSVVNWLAAQGIAAGGFSAVGFGESRPVAGNGTPQGKALNRRVEVRVIK